MKTNKYQEMRDRDQARLTALRTIEIAYTGPLGLLNPFAEMAKRQRFFNSLTYARRMELMLYLSYRRQLLN